MQTYKEGLLSAVGHDVLLSVGTFSIDATPERVIATFDPATLKVECATKAGVPDRAALSDKDKRTIEGYVAQDILHPRRYPRIKFQSTSIEREGDGWEIEGDLELHGRTRKVRATVELRDGEVVTKVRLNQTDFGITPFRAMLGALRIQSQVDVELTVPRAALEGA
ncbi:MAG: YceI family protein [Myxococcota bacterium]